MVFSDLVEFSVRIRTAKMAALAEAVAVVALRVNTAGMEVLVAEGVAETIRHCREMVGLVEAVGRTVARPLVATVATAEAVALVLRADPVGLQLSASTTKEQPCTMY